MYIPGLRRLGWRRFFKQLYHEIDQHAATDSAAQLSYYFLFSIFPFLVFVVTLTAYLPLGSSVESLLNRLAGFMPQEAMNLVSGTMQGLVQNERPSLLTAGLLFTLWAASRGVDAVRKALNLAYDVKETRPFWKTQGIAILLTIAGAVGTILAIALMLLGSKVGLWFANHLDIGAEAHFFVSILRWPLIGAIVMIVAAIGYYFLPDVKQEFRFITPGSMMGALVWLLTMTAFAMYVERFGRYNVTYGSLGGVIILMTWLYISGFIFILGGEINAILEHASTDGKSPGAHAPDEAPPPPEERPSQASPGELKHPPRPSPVGGPRKSGAPA